MLENVKLSSDDVRVTSALKVTAPEYVCVPFDKTLAPKLDAPLTLNTPTLVLAPIAPFKSKLPVIVKF